MSKKRLLISAVLFLTGFALGGAAFVNTQPRNLIGIADCKGHCGPGPQAAGFLTAIGVRLTPNFLPNVVGQSQHCLAVRSPMPGTPVDILFFPKRDIKNLLDLTHDDEEGLLDCYALMRKVVDERRIKDWLVYSNGPGAQRIAYLHFHLLAHEESPLK